MLHIPVNTMSQRVQLHRHIHVCASAHRLILTPHREQQDKMHRYAKKLLVPLPYLTRTWIHEKSWLQLTHASLKDLRDEHGLDICVAPVLARLV